MLDTKDGIEVDVEEVDVVEVVVDVGVVEVLEVVVVGVVEVLEVEVVDEEDETVPVSTMASLTASHPWLAYELNGIALPDCVEVTVVYWAAMLHDVSEAWAIRANPDPAFCKPPEHPASTSKMKSLGLDVDTEAVGMYHADG